MAVRFRVYPNNGMHGMNAQYSPQQIARERADHTENLAGSQLGWEGKLWDARIRRAQLETAMQYMPPGGGMMQPIMPGFGGIPVGGHPAMFGAGIAQAPFGFGGVPAGFGGVPAGFGTMGMPGLGGGQVNVTNQTASAGDHPVNQQVSNRNHVSQNVVHLGGFGASPFGFGGLGGGFGGWLNGLLSWF